jgi:ElaB/YqjD/DUF883 family membrane-anchored ribosome-binding protein
MRSTSQTTPNALGRDIQNVVSDAQELLKSVQSEGENRLADVKTRVQTQVDHARQSLGEIQHTIQDGAKVAIRETDAYVHANPWAAVGVGAAVGLLIGFLAARR